LSPLLTMYGRVGVWEYGSVGGNEGIYYSPSLVEDCVLG